MNIYLLYILHKLYIELLAASFWRDKFPEVPDESRKNINVRYVDDWQVMVLKTLFFSICLLSLRQTTASVSRQGGSLGGRETGPSRKHRPVWAGREGDRSQQKAQTSLSWEGGRQVPAESTDQSELGGRKTGPGRKHRPVWAGREGDRSRQKAQTSLSWEGGRQVPAESTDQSELGGRETGPGRKHRPVWAGREGDQSDQSDAMRFNKRHHVKWATR